jgi:hypothetical protein
MQNRKREKPLLTVEDYEDNGVPMPTHTLKHEGMVVETPIDPLYVILLKQVLIPLRYIHPYTGVITPTYTN